ncbi:hypothetical protein D3C71_772930 [compost metagenome]
MGDDGIGKTVAGIHLFQPKRLGDLLIAGAFGLDMHGADQPLFLRQGEEMLGQEIAAQRVVVTKEKLLVIFLLQPGIATGAEVPQMMMGIDHRQRIFGGEVRQAVAFMQGDHGDVPGLSAKRSGAQG